jgi:hypothetical protein
VKVVINVGGRAAAGYKESTSDCVCRAIASGLPYQEVYRELAMGQGKQCLSKRAKRRGNPWQVKTAENGISVTRTWFEDYMRGLSSDWVAPMKIGFGCKVHLAEGELPVGRLVVSVSKHYVAVIVRVLHDTHNSTRGESRSVYARFGRSTFVGLIAF